MTSTLSEVFENPRAAGNEYSAGIAQGNHSLKTPVHPHSIPFLVFVLHVWLVYVSTI